MLFEVDPIYLHYMTDRQERFDLKLSKLISKWTIHLINYGMISCSVLRTVISIIFSVSN